MASVIAYHGTNREAAASIHREGFRPETWFSWRLEDALGFGGPCIFMVEFSDDPKRWSGFPEEDDWQFHTSIPIEPEHILGYTIIKNEQEMTPKMHTGNPDRL
jgi:hypothetical protein